MCGSGAEMARLADVAIRIAHITSWGGMGRMKAAIDGAHEWMAQAANPYLGLVPPPPGSFSRTGLCSGLFVLSSLGTPPGSFPGRELIHEA